MRIQACIHVYTGLCTYVHTRVLAVYAAYPVFRAVQALYRYGHVQACNTWGARLNTGLHIRVQARIWAILGMGDLLTQIWVESLISPARVRPRVYTRTRIMRARGRAHAPARGVKSLTCSRISYFAYAVLGLALIQGISGICCI